MGKCETATASIGISILLSDVILQINEKNFNLIKEMLNSGYIEDDNDYYNEGYQKVINSYKFTGNHIVVKEYLITKFKDIGSSSYGGDLFDQVLLIPVKEILTNDRWGYDRYGRNCISIPIDFDLSLNIQKYKDIEKFNVVFLLSQNSF